MHWGNAGWTRHEVGGSNNEANRDRRVPEAENLGARSIGQIDETNYDTYACDDLEAARLGSCGATGFMSEVAELDNARSHAKIPVAQRDTT